MADFIVVMILVIILGAAIAYIIREKKRGAKCIGCPSEGGCPHKQGKNSCSCGDGFHS